MLVSSPGATASINSILPAGTSATVPTDGDGIALFTVTSLLPAWQSPDAFIDVTFTAEVDSDPIGSGTVRFTSQIPDLNEADLEGPLLSTITASPPAVLANGSDTSTVTVILRDADGVQLVGAGPTVTLLPQVQGGGVPAGTPANTIVGPFQVVSTNGVAEFTVASNTAQIVEYRAAVSGPTIDGDDQIDTPPAVVTFVDVIGDADNSTVVVVPPHDIDPVIANNVSTAIITVTLLDGDTPPIPVEGAGVALSVLGVSGGPVTAGDVTITPIGTPISNASGVVQFLVRSSSHGVVEFQATSAIPITQTASVTFIEQVVSQAVSTVEADPNDVLANGVSSSTVTVTALDADSVPVVGAAVSLTQGGGSSVISAPTPADGLSDVNGEVSFTVTNVNVEVVTYGAIINALVITDTDTVDFETPVPTIANSDVVADPTSVIANGVSYSTVTVTLGDADGEPIPNQAVTLSGNAANNVTVIQSNTDASGVALFEVRSTTVGVETFTAASGGWSDTVAVTFTTQLSDPTKATLTASPGIVIANGMSTSTITLTLFDADGVQLLGSGVNVALDEDSIAGTDSATIQGSNLGVTTAGVATFTVSSSTIQTVEYGAIAAGDNVTATTSVMFIPQTMDPLQSTITVSPLEVVANGVSYATVTVTLRDGDGYLIPGMAVSVIGSTTVMVEELNNGLTNSDGEAFFRVRRATPAAGVVFSAFTGPENVDPVGPTDDAVNFIAPVVNAGSSTVVANPTSVAANGIAFSTVTVTLFDQVGVPMQGVNVSLAGDGNAATDIGPASGPSNSNGEVTFAVRRTAAGAVTFFATANSVEITDTAQVTFTQPAPSGILSFLTASPHAVEADGTDSSVITVRVVDSSGVAIAGVTDITLSQGGGSSVISAISGPTNASGEATFTVTNTTVEEVTYTATVEGTTVSNTTGVFFYSVDGTPPPSGQGCTFPPVPAGQFLPALQPTGVMISIYGGGPISSLPSAVSYWGTFNAQLIGYIPGAPNFVNAQFNAAFANGIPACKGFIIRR